MQTLLPILSWLSDHQLYAWIGLSLIVNIALRARTAEQWIAWCKTKPRLVIRLMRKLGVDPVGVIEAVKTIITGKARVDPFTAVLAAPKYHGPSGALGVYNLNDLGVTRLGKGSDAAYNVGMVGQIAYYSSHNAGVASFRWSGPLSREIHADYYDGHIIPGAAYRYRMNEGGAATGPGGMPPDWTVQPRP